MSTHNFVGLTLEEKVLKFYYTATSPFARKVRILLAEMKLAHEGVDVSPGDAAQVVENLKAEKSLFGDEYEKLVPSLKVPAIQDGDQLIFESNAIMTYLYQKGTSISSESVEIPLAPTVIRPEHVWLDTMILTTIDILMDSMINVAQISRFGVDPKSNSYLVRQAKRAQSCLDWLEARVSPKGFYPGFFSVADINMICALQMFDARGSVNWRGRSNLESMLTCHESRASIKEHPVQLL